MYGEAPHDIRAAVKACEGVGHAVREAGPFKNEGQLAWEEEGLIRAETPSKPLVTFRWDLEEDAPNPVFELK